MGNVVPSLCCSKRDTLQNGHIIFHYGASNPYSLAQKLGIEPEEITQRAVACIVKDYALAFCGKSKQWNGKSIATIVPMEKHIVRGFFIMHTEKELQILNTFEGYPFVFDRVQV
jgi:hypothetical protein